MRRSIASSLLSIAAVAWLAPSLLFCGGNPDYARAEMLLRETLKELTPSTDVAFGFTKATQRLAHLSKPWQTWKTNTSGTFLLADDVSSFYQADSLQSGKTTYSSFTYCCDTTLVVFDYGETEPDKVTVSEKHDFIYDVSVLTPIFLLKDFLLHASESSFLRYVGGPIDSLVYNGAEGKIIAFAIDPKKEELRSISVTECDPLYGDVVSTVIFDEYLASDAGDFKYPTKIIERRLGFDANVVTVGLSHTSFDKARILGMIPPTYHLVDDPPQAPEEIVRTDYNDHIHLLDLKHTGSRVMVVEFRDYLLVAGAPLNTKNGEMIIAEAHRIAPDKPIRYFVFGHHHPHYIGGIRAFVHEGSTILSMAPDSAYAEQLVSFRHSLEPDILEREPRPFTIETFDREKTLSDGDVEMRMIDIDTLSHHAANFLIYYFPKEKLLFQDELGWIPTDKPLTAANVRQKGLYDAIKLYKLDVDTILQGWPLDRGMKMIFNFTELEQSVKMLDEKK